jgi:phosphate-selective porin OprO/OprP
MRAVARSGPRPIRQLVLRLLPCVALLLPTTCSRAADETAEAQPAQRSFEIRGYASSLSWHDGLYYGIDAPDLPATIEAGELRWRPLVRGQIGLRIAVDAAGVRQHGDFIDLDDDVAVRRGYFYADGEIQPGWKPVSFKLEIGAVNDRFSLRNASFAVHEIPYAGTLRLGTFDAPMSLAWLGSSRATPLMEHGMVLDAFDPGSLSGIQLSNALAAQRLTWAFGFFSEGSDADTGDSSNVPARFVGRATWLPWRSAEELLHVGLSTSWAFATNEIHYRARPESFLAPYVVDTGDLDASQALVVAAESVWVRGRLSVQGEYMNATVVRNAGSDVDFGGFYVMTSLFLTPDTRAYHDADAAFGPIVPSRPVSWRARQIGAVEIAARWSIVDLTDGDVRGGRASVVTSGLNWYLNRFLRLQVDVGWSHASGGPRPGDAAVLQARFDLTI